jgi:hypothetical protein
MLSQAPNGRPVPLLDNKEKHQSLRGSAADGMLHSQAVPARHEACSWVFPYGSSFQYLSLLFRGLDRNL